MVTPYYNKPTQDEVIRRIKNPRRDEYTFNFIYNIPGKSIIDIHNDTLARLFKLDRIIGIKDATGDLNRPIELNKIVEKEIAHFSGEDDNALDFYRIGGNGLISVTSNLFPDIVSKIFTLCTQGKFDEASKLQTKLKHVNKGIL